MMVSQRKAGDGKARIARIVLGIGLVALLLMGLAWRFGWPPLRGDSDPKGLSLNDIPFDGARAFGYLERLCALGPRPSGSEGMRRQREVLVEHFQSLGAEVQLQEFQHADPRDGSPLAMANMVVHWHPRSTERILLCAHYDTLPYPLLDPRDPGGRFVGANDGASGVALLMELAHEIPQMELSGGVDFVLFDGEEYVFAKGGRYFVGSTHFAQTYRDDPPPYRYRCGVLLDMIGDADLQVYHEGNSTQTEETRALVRRIWSTARRLGVHEFIARQKHTVRDDHLPLNYIAEIPTIDIIDFDYPTWHTQGDTPDKCSPLSLAKVGWVVREWLQKELEARDKAR